MYTEFMQKGSVVALGSFDGLHIGHMAVINNAKNLASMLGAVPCICTFSEHPLKVLTGKEPPALFTGDVRDEAFRSTGIEVVRLDFASIMHMSPEQFFEEILFKTLHVAGVCCGFNYSFGDGGKGTPEMMDRLCAEKGVIFSASDATVLDGEPVSSTRIRNALGGGNVELANRMLGRPFKYRQQVVDGDKRGRTWGIPTINQPFPEELVVPRHGVYASRCIVDGKTYFGATNIGVRPTVKENDVVASETYLLDYEGDLYGKYVDVCLLKFLRPEKKFDTVEALEQQIHTDIETVRKIGGMDILA
ncbi:MAG: riboflavin biosynthesis protein RibF [Clostridia bacterium]|nr:riboflavin biosynthesis protein RibF [Clostridia bacterium]MBR1704938.1 riboflavin biosynthesis protein RibF [Clostridia bacterium]